MIILLAVPQKDFILTLRRDKINANKGPMMRPLIHYTHDILMRQHGFWKYVITSKHRNGAVFLTHPVYTTIVGIQCIRTSAYVVGILHSVTNQYVG